MKAFMLKTGRSRTWEVILIIGMLTILNCGFSFAGWPLTFKATARTFAVILLLFFLYFLFWGGRLTNKQHFRYYVLTLAVLPFASVFYSHSEYGQPILDGIKGTLPSLLWLFYFVLHHYKVKEGSFLKAMLYIAIFILLVQVIQQFTYPHAWFGIRGEENLTADQELAENRNGIWRFNIGLNGIFTAVCLFYFWCKLRRSMTVYYPVIIALMLLSIYLTLTRQLMFSALLTLFLSFFMGRRKMKVWPLLIGVVTIVALYFYWDVLFGYFQKQTSIDSGKDYIRFLSANYYWTETFSSVKAAILGHGSAVSGSLLSLKTELEEEYRFYVSDVGLIGMMWVYGVIYVIVCYALLIHVSVKYRHHIPLYVSLLIIFTTIPSVMIFPMISPIQYVMWSFLLYICDVHINRSKRLRLIRLLLRKRKLNALTAHES